MRRARKRMPGPIFLPPARELKKRSLLTSFALLVMIITILAFVFTVSISLSYFLLHRTDAVEYSSNNR